MKKTLLASLTFPLLAYKMVAKKRKVGGQAIIEGVMMRGKDNVSWAVRKNEHEVVVERQEYISFCLWTGGRRTS